MSDKDILANEITDDIYKALMAELKIEMDMLLMKDPRSRQQEEGH